MAEMNELHFETIDRNKDINMQRNKIKYLEDRIAIHSTSYVVGLLMIFGGMYLTLSCLPAYGERLL